MNLVFSLCLPRDGASVPVVRHLFRGSLQRLGVKSDCIDDVEVAVTEACSNVLRHAAGTDAEYEVTAELNDTHCEIRVTDTGKGFDHSTLSDDARPSAESGRGIQLMRALVDNVRFVSRPEEGTIVHLEKELELEDDSVLRVTAAA